MNELELIQRLTQSLPSNAALIQGAGDDCAILDMGIPGQWLLFKTDAVVEGVHFTTETPPEKIGRKALARCLSDFAAMAGTPVSALITLALPAEFDPERIEKIYAGMNQLAEQVKVSIAGGETTSNPSGLLISIAMVGTVSRDHCIHRSGAKLGDGIFVTGELGGSIAGHHLDFEPRLDEARWLAREFKPHCMMDLSDGLATDLRHILNATRLGAELRAQSIPISREAKLASRTGTMAKPALLAALTDGEDFELLFTLGAKEAVPLLDAWKEKFPHTRLTCIGRIQEGEGITLRDLNGVRPLTAHGYIHFNQP